MIKGGYQIVDLSKYEFKDIRPDGGSISGDFSDILDAIKTCNKPILFMAPKVGSNDYVSSQGYAYPYNPQFASWITIGVNVLFTFHDETDTTHNNKVEIRIKPDGIEMTFDPVV